MFKLSPQQSSMQTKQLFSNLYDCFEKRKKSESESGDRQIEVDDLFMHTEHSLTQCTSFHFIFAYEVIKPFKRIHYCSVHFRC